MCFFFERTLIFGLNNFLHEHDCHQKFWAQIREEHLNSGRWNLLPGGKLNITLFEANFILRLEGPKTGWDGVVLKGWDMGWDGWVSKTVRCVCVLLGSRAVQEYPEFPTRVWEAQVVGLELVHGS